MSKKFLGNYRGLVVDNLDPAGLGRIKVKVYPMFKGIDDAYELPWAVPAMGLFAGAGEGFGAFAVPNVDSFVYVFFEAGNIYQPVYFAEAQTAGAGIPVASQVDYPESKVWQTKSGIAFYVNQKEGSEEITVYHPTGTFMTIMPDGSIDIFAKTSITMQANDGDLTLIAASDNIILSAAKNITAYAGQDATVNAAGRASVTAGTDVSVTAGGKVSVSAAGAATVTAGLAATVSAKDVVVTGATGVYLQSAGEVAVTANVIELTATGAINMLAPIINLN